MDLKEAGQIAGKIEDHWYYETKLAAVERSCLGTKPSSILDVGAGIGFFSRALLKHEFVRCATCVDPGFDRDSDEEVFGKPFLRRRVVSCCNADLVLMMDVIEHVPDDVELVTEYVGMARLGTDFLLTVPAFPWLWSGHDEYLGHYRRYTLRGLEQVVRSAGLKVELGCYLYGALLPVVAAGRLGGRAWGSLVGRRRAYSQMRDHGPALNGIFGAVCRAEAPLAFHNRIGGITAMVRARKVA